VTKAADPWPKDDRSREFAYINSVHRINIGRGTPLTWTPDKGLARSGKVAWDNRDGHIFIKFDDAQEPEGPFHPVRGMQYGQGE